MNSCSWAANVLLSCLLCVSACQTKDSTPATAKEPSEPASARAADSPAKQLAALDHRTPVPLQPMMAWHQKQNMMEHLVVVQRITEGLSREDWEAIEQASALIEASPQMQQMCEHMGAGARGFTEKALDFHQRAVAIGDAARAQDAVGVLQATAHTLQACTACHATFRQDVVDAQEWQQRTGSAVDPWQMHGGH